MSTITYSTASAPFGHCRHCGAAMDAVFSPAGEPQVECPGCHWPCELACCDEEIARLARLVLMSGCTVEHARAALAETDDHGALTVAIAATEGCSLRMAADWARAERENLRAYAAGWDAMSVQAQQAQQTVAQELAGKARAIDARSWERAFDKAAYHLAQGVQAQRVPGGWLVPSATRATQVYRVTDTGCSCEAGRAGRPCWHRSLVTTLELAETNGKAVA